MLQAIDRIHKGIALLATLAQSEATQLSHRFAIGWIGDGCPHHPDGCPPDASLVFSATLFRPSHLAHVASDGEASDDRPRNQQRPAPEAGPC